MPGRLAQVAFINFKNVEDRGIPDDVDVIITQSVALGAAPLGEHFILKDQAGPVDFGVEKSFVYVSEPGTAVLAADPNRHVLMAVNRFGQRRSVYLAGLPCNPKNSRLLHRALFWASGKEKLLKRWFSCNPQIDCAAFPDTGFFCSGERRKQ